MSQTSNPLASAKTVTDAWEAVFRAQVAVMRKIVAMPEFCDLTVREYDVLFNLRICPGGRSRLVDLNQHLLISQPSLSRMITRLEVRGLIAREPDPEDQRATLLSLTSQGRKVQQQIAKEHVAHLRQLLGHALSEDEFHQLQHLSTKLRNAVES